MAGTSRWQYALVWHSGLEFSTVTLIAVTADGRRHPWDAFNTSGFPELPTHRQVLDELYHGCVTALERTTHTV